jgi:hypothetical protein
MAVFQVVTTAYTRKNVELKGGNYMADKRRKRHRRGTLGDWCYRNRKAYETEGLVELFIGDMRHDPNLPEFGSLAGLESYVRTKRIHLDEEWYPPDVEAAVREIWRLYCAWKWPHLKPEEVRVRWLPPKSA